MATSIYLFKKQKNMNNKLTQKTKVELGWGHLGQNDLVGREYDQINNNNNINNNWYNNVLNHKIRDIKMSTYLAYTNNFQSSSQNLLGKAPFEG